MEIKSWWAAKPHWVRGGIFGVVFIAVYFILFSIVDSNLFYAGLKYKLELLSAPFSLPLGLAWDLLDLIPVKDMRLITPGQSGLKLATSFLALFAVYFLIGALIGWTIGKIKK